MFLPTNTLQGVTEMNGNDDHNNSSSSVSNVMKIHQELAVMCELVNELKLCYKISST